MTPATQPHDGRARVVIVGIQPTVDGGLYPIKRVAGESVVVKAELVCDGHDVVSGLLMWRHHDDETWSETPLLQEGNDVYAGAFGCDRIGTYHYYVQAWVDRFASWRQDALKRLKADQLLPVHLATAAALVAEVDLKATPDGRRHAHLLKALMLKGLSEGDFAAQRDAILDESLLDFMHRHQPRLAAVHSKHFSVTVDPTRARSGAWYEFFPRSTGVLGEHGTFYTAAKRLPDIAEMGFDIVYLPPIHPIGTSFRKGKNNTLQTKPGDVGSPWAIGAREGGHMSVHPALGTLEDFRWFVKEAALHGLDVALDLALQCSPDHPYVKQHPEWFRHLPDGSIQYAENPPKKYQDIYPLDFECADWKALWQEMKRVVAHWIDHGVKIFRVDNPHTKTFAFWQWLISEIKREHPEVWFLAEAFTRPRPMHTLAKLGFSQSYTYFPWRNDKHEIETYFSELARAPQSDYFRGNHWPNTPDILTEYLQHGGRAGFVVRAVLAATLAANYGIYGPPFEFCEHIAREGSEEYVDNEKYQLRHWAHPEPNNLRELLTVLNRTRHDNPALQNDKTLFFHPTDNDQLITYSKRTTYNVVCVVVNLDPHHTQSGIVALDANALGVAADATVQMHDVLSSDRFLWTIGRDNRVTLTPQTMPAHVFVMRQRIRSENDFEYFT